jgi:hypothetical protein
VPRRNLGTAPEEPVAEEVSKKLAEEFCEFRQQLGHVERTPSWRIIFHNRLTLELTSGSYKSIQAPDYRV